MHVQPLVVELKQPVNYAVLYKYLCYVLLDQRGVV